MRRLMRLTALLVAVVVLSACGGDVAPEAEAPAVSPGPDLPPPYEQAKYASVTLAPDLQSLRDDEREALPLLEAALDSIDEAFWRQVYGKKSALLKAITDPAALRFAEINYGPWDRLDDDVPFLPVGPRPGTSRFYPLDLQPGELDMAGAAAADGGASLRAPYTVVRRNENRGLMTIPFHEFYSEQVDQASDLLSRAAKILGQSSLGRYLALQAEALKSDSYADSDRAWLKVDGPLGMVIGPLDPGEDYVNRLKRAYAGALWVARPEWGSRISRYRSSLPELVSSLVEKGPAGDRRPVAFQVVDLIDIAGSWNAGPKRFVLELPMDPSLRKEFGTRRLLLRNVARAKFDLTLVPLAEVLIVPEQRDRISFDAFFTNDLLLEMVRAEGASAAGQALKRIYGEAAWIVGVLRANAIAACAVGQLAERDESGSSVEEHFTTLVASAFRALRFRSTSAQGPAALILLNKLLKDEAIVRDEDSSTYRIDVPAVQRSVQDLARRLAGAEADENTGEIATFLAEMSQSNPELVDDLNRLVEARVPIDIAFEN